MVPPLLKLQMSTILNYTLESGCIPSARGLVLPNKSIGDQNAPQPKVCSDHYVPHHQNATFKAATRIMKAIIFTIIPWPRFSDDKYWMVEEAQKPTIKDPN
jgi:hypothetical protein